MTTSLVLSITILIVHLVGIISFSIISYVYIRSKEKLLYIMYIISTLILSGSLINIFIKLLN